MVYVLVVSIAACGIENVVYLYPPPQDSVYDTSDLVDASKRYCRFTTADSLNTGSAAEYFQGTEIYYRIYEREADCIEDRTQINRYNDSNPSSVAQYLQDTKKYARLRCSGISASQRPLIARSGSDRNVRFRLQDYGIPGSGFDPALLTVGGSSLGIPYRDGKIISSKQEFKGTHITVGDEDVQRASVSVSESYWYVHFYAVSYGYDKSFRTLYSSLTALGFIRVDRTP